MKQIDDTAWAIALPPADGSLMIVALAECPFKLVYELIGKLNQQANAASPLAANAAQEFLLTATELRLIIAALGNMPFNQVHSLVAELHRQMQELQSEPSRGLRAIRKNCA